MELTKYAVIKKPYHPLSFTIYYVYAHDFLDAIERFKLQKQNYNPKHKYALFNIEPFDNDNQDVFTHITDLY